MGLPTVQICSMKQVAVAVGSPRIVAGRSVLHPVGDPSLSADEERSLRRRIVEDALRALASAGGEHAA